MFANDLVNNLVNKYYLDGTTDEIKLLKFEMN